GNAGSEANWADAKDASAQMGANLVRIDVSRADELEKAFMTAKGTGALLVQFDFLFAMMRKQIAELAAQTRIPAIYENQAQALAGGLMSYGGDLRENYREGAVYVDRILKGARPADLPVIQASRFELVLNKGAAKAIGLTIPYWLCASVARPGGKLTRPSLYPTLQLATRALQLTKEVVPGVSRIALLRDPTNPSHLLLDDRIVAAARALGLKPQLIDVRGAVDFQDAF